MNDSGFAELERDRSAWYAIRNAFADSWVLFFASLAVFGTFVIISPLLGIRIDDEDDMPIWFQSLIGIPIIIGGLAGFFSIFPMTYHLIRRGVILQAVIISDESPLGKDLLGGKRSRRGLRRVYEYDYRGKTYRGYTCSLLAGPAGTEDIAVLQLPDWTGREIEVLVDPERPSVSRVLGVDVFLSRTHRRQHDIKSG